jgi:NAD(P)-dependent dehydrogenase (short-subunit alcohol dehydrogenase family)
MSTSTVGKYASKLSGARILILGGTSGIGFCVAEACVEQNATVIVSSSSPAKISKAIERLKTSYPDKSANISGHPCDLSKPALLDANLSTLLNTVTDGAKAKLDHIVYTSGDALQIVPLSEYTIENMYAAGTVRFFGPLLLGKLAPAFMNPGPTSSITFTGGTNSDKPNKGWVVVAAYGAGMEGIARGLAVDLAPLRVNMVSPGATHTELFGDIPDAVLQSFAAGTLTNTVGKPEDVAEAYVYAMRDRFITGTVISTDGGRLLK